MTEDITSLQIKILYDQVENAEKRLVSLETQGKKTQRSIEGMAGAVTAQIKGLYQLATASALVVTAYSALKAVIEKTAEFQKLNAQLITATGSVQDAGEAFRALQKYAKDTPFSLIESTEAFTKLVNYGLTPSERAMRSYGDAAAATSKKVDQMVEAVADAVNGDFERVKNAFNVKAKNMGDTINFTFRNATTSVKNNARDIEKYFIELGEKNFAGAMDRLQATLNGKFSAIGDEWDKLLNNIGENGLGDAVTAGATDLLNILSELNAEISSGELPEKLKEWGASFTDFGDLAKEAWNGIDGVASLALMNIDGYLDETGKKLDIHNDKWNDVAHSIVGIGPAVILMARTVETELAGILLKMDAIITKSLRNPAQNFGEEFTYSYAKNHPNSPYGENGSMTPKLPEEAKQGAVFGADNALLGDKVGTGATSPAASEKELNDQINALDAAIKEQEANNIGKYTQKILDIDDSRTNAELNRNAYNADQAAQAANKEDKLAKYGVGGSGNPNNSKKKGKGKNPDSIKDSDGDSFNDFKQLAKTLGDGDKLYEAEYEKRIRIIEKFTAQGSRLQEEMELSATDKFQEEEEKRIDKMKQTPSLMQKAFAEEERLIEESYERRKEIILKATDLTEKERVAMLKQAEEKAIADQEKLTKERAKVILDGTSLMLDDLSTIADAYGKKGFAVSKALAMANATVKGIEATISAYEKGTEISVYAGPIFAAIAAAATGAQIAKIAGTQYAGAKAIGGLIPAGMWGIAGEAGPEIVTGPAMVQSAQSTWDRKGGARSDGGKVSVNVHNYAGAKVETQTQEGPNGEQQIALIVTRVEKTLTKKIHTGGNSFSGAFEKNYGVRRGSQ